ncbi:MAG TPA: biopolymer transporter ExbD [Candidatus Udaeobacter sp.]
MNLRSHAPLHHPGIQLAPLVDVLLLLLIFFLLTWNAARNENELAVKVPKASAAKEKTSPIGDVVVNVKADGNVVVNRRTLSAAELSELLKGLVQLNAEQAVVIRGDEAGAYRNVIGVLNICSEAGITNVAFATAK